ncbi:PLP-dependent aminotransferase family protein [Zhihengliuella halotolerans]|uniref:GntR family transcriptional regulator n=1 Tax=Zhihengliuella halotolerans TaxID=370736 RepID=A0A4Q8AHR3_9MICC|nr:PLP-dependent aminotransferase family protein [Zhihengliuella halotolerans]RZU63249.1 GntR family transcriptional regulator [Zhihengliuella halotolerans]
MSTVTPARRLGGTRLAAMLGAPDSARPAYAWLAESIRQLIANGRVIHGTALPSERQLVDALGLSRTTVSRAYAELRDRGYASAHVGAGTIARVPGGPVAGGGEPLPLGGFGPRGGSSGEYDDGGEPTAVDLTCAAPSAPLGLADVYQEALDELPAYINGMGYFPLGVPALREAIAADYTRRGVPTDADQILVTSGALAGVAATARLLLKPGAVALAESPTYPNSVTSLRHHGVRVASVPIGADGTDVDAVAGGLRSSGARVMLCLPDFHNPVGTLASDEVRERWAGELRRAGATGIVDETCARLWLDEEPDVRPMAAFSNDVVTIGSASKSHWGGLRLGWIRAPHAMVGGLARMRMTLDLGAPVLDQLVLARLMERGSGLVPETRERLRSTRDAVLDQAARLLPDWRARRPAGGLSLWFELPRPASTALAAAAERRGVLLAPGSAFAVEDHGLEHWMRIPFAQTERELAWALPRIAEAWGEAAGREPGPRQRRAMSTTV